jgi:hypothetical protein
MGDFFPTAGKYFLCGSTTSIYRQIATIHVHAGGAPEAQALGALEHF